MVQSDGSGSRTECPGGSGFGQLPGGNPAELGCPKHARRAGSMSNAGDRAEKYNKTDNHKT
jgi:hypothetical protein